ncbi:MAG: arylsulfatase [Cytophagaceae bacterium]|jgi:arylsulfatase|nr:arylsulfatase [Cytophagaceae bacterium]
MLRKLSLFLLCIATLFTACTENTKTQAPEEKKPNILFIVADDMGFSDIEPYGGNIATPNLNNLASQSLLFSNFYVQPTCSPTRSSLLTGADHHIAGIGIMSEMHYPALDALNLPEYNGHLNTNVVTIPELLKENGYHTYMTGKWHLGEGKGLDPYDRGFEETFILGTGGGSHWKDKKALSPLQHMEYTSQGTVVDLPNDFYSSKNYTDSMIHFIDKHTADGKPFFGYLSYTAAHDPLHAPKEYIDKYKGKFDAGWDSLWAERFANLKKLGILPKNLKASPSNPAIPKWEKLSPDQQKQLARDMEVYAAMIEYMDMSIGKIIQYLKDKNLYDNTLIVFLSDNGANGAVASTYPGNEDGKYHNSFNNSIDNKGLINSYAEAGPGWAQASTSPFRYFKSFTTEGGIKAPLIVKLPKHKASNTGEWNAGLVHVTDIMPTVLEISGTPYPATFRQHTIQPIYGKSILPILTHDSISVHTSDGFGWELFEMKAYRKEDWKIVRLPKPMGSGDWELYHITSDPCESVNRSSEFPKIKEDLIQRWKAYAIQNRVYDHKGHYDSLYLKSFTKK